MGIDNSDSPLAKFRTEHNVELCSEQELFHIDAQGQWFYQQSQLPNKFAKLFSQILQLEGDQYFLVTPVEKVKVTVKNVPFNIVDFNELASGAIELTSSIGTVHQLNNVEAFVVHESAITCVVERELSANLNRACYYRFIEKYLN
ncbi:MAG: DUF1285 domain-containing protein [Parashewanella sp.]